MSTRTLDSASCSYCEKACIISVQKEVPAARQDAMVPTTACFYSLCVFCFLNDISVTDTCLSPQGPFSRLVVFCLASLPLSAPVLLAFAVPTGTYFVSQASRSSSRHLRPGCSPEGLKQNAADTRLLGSRFTRKGRPVTTSLQMRPSAQTNK